MNEVNAAIVEFINRLREGDLEKFNPIWLSQSRERYSTAGIAEVVNAVALLSESETRLRVQKAFVEQQASILRLGIEAAIANGWDEERVVDFVRDTDQIDISIQEIQTILNTPEKVITSKTDYTNIDRQKAYLDGIIRIYAMTNGSEEGYQLNPRAYVIARMLINDAINEILNPISNIANDYTKLQEFYKNRSVDRTLHLQFSKYQLVAVTDGIQLSDSAPPRLYDSTNDVTVLLCGTKDAVFEYLRGLRRRFEFDLAFKPCSLYFMDGNFQMSRMVEHLETGHYFNNVNLDGSLITKLYDDHYETLWINVYDNSITFEEFQNDFQIHGDYVVTQVLHCEYFKEGNEYFVLHLDHEFIFYDMAEYEKRQSDAWQKGNARKRIKTFKIDNGRIPLSPGANILFDFLEMKFQNRSLIREYFDKIQTR